VPDAKRDVRNVTSRDLPVVAVKRAGLKSARTQLIYDGEGELSSPTQGIQISRNTVWTRQVE
jgi:hypothetical protein